MEHFSDPKIYIVHYKPGTVIKNGGLYQPLMSGNSDSREHAVFVGDDTGEHISTKNPFYSELTGIYWIWKNTRQPITGLCHYRRFFTVRPEPLLYKGKRLLYSLIGLADKRHGLIYTKDIERFADSILNEEELQVLFKQYDAVLPQARKLKYSVREHYRRYHDIHDLTIIESILKERYPEYLEAYSTVLQGNRLYANNMFIMKDVPYQKFMDWWFDILFEFERRTNMAQYTGYQKRIMGFVSERLLTVWFKKEQLKCKELQLIYFKSLKYE